MKTKLIFFVIAFFINFHYLNSQVNDFKVVGYFPNWTDWNKEIESLDYSKLTHICWAFQNPNSSGVLSEPDNGLTELVQKAQSSGIKVLISLGGGAASGSLQSIYFDLISTSTKRAAFVQNIQNYIIQNNLQGIDVDIEGSAINSNYGFFIQQLVDSLRPKGYLITAALNGLATDNISDETLQLFDWINIMSYDFTGSWTPNDPGQHSSYDHAVQGINAYLSRGCAAEKLVLGVPFYGHAFNNLIGMDYNNYDKILEDFPDAYLHDQRGNVIYYNGIATIQRKTYLALDKIGGIMIWELSGDVHNEYSLLTAIDDAIKMYNPNDMPPIVNITIPSNDTSILESFINIQAHISDTDGVFTRTELFANNSLIDETDRDTVSFTVKNLSEGNYVMVIAGIDHQGKIGYDTLNVAVNQVNRYSFDSLIHSVPGKIEAEHYDVGASGESFSDISEGNMGGKYRADDVDIEVCSDIDGGYNIGWISTGEWLEYTINISNTDFYQFQFRVAASASGKKIRAEIDGFDVTGDLPITGTGGWQKWADVSSNAVELEKGEHVLRLYFVTGNFNFNYLNVVVAEPSSVFKKNDFKAKIYPIPAQNELNLEWISGNDYSVKITNELGIVVKKFEVINSQLKNVVLITDLSGGVYILHITSNNLNSSQIFIKE